MHISVCVCMRVCDRLVSFKTALVQRRFAITGCNLVEGRMGQNGPMRQNGMAGKY